MMQLLHALSQHGFSYQATLKSPLAVTMRLSKEVAEDGSTKEVLSKKSTSTLHREVQALRKKLNPSAPNVRAMSYAYPGGAEAFKADIVHERAVREAEDRKTEHAVRVDFADVWRQSFTAQVEHALTKEERRESGVGHATWWRAGDTDQVLRSVPPCCRGAPGLIKKRLRISPCTCGKSTAND